MSLVSDAHRRANGEMVTTQGPPRSISVSSWALSIVLAAAIGSAVTVWFVSTAFTPDSEVVVEPTPTPVIHNAVSSANPAASGSADSAETRTSAEPSAALMALYDRARAERASFTQRSVESEMTESSMQNATNSAQEPSQSELSVPAQASMTPAGIDENQLLARAQSLLASSQRDAALASALPLLDSLSDEARNSVPTLLYSAHDYQSQGVSKVMINREWWSEGQQISGIKIIEIREKSTVFETRDGTRFLLPALSSWVNL